MLSIKKLLKTLFLFVAIFLVIAIVRFPYESYCDELIEMTKSAGRSRNVLLAIEGCSLGFPPTTVQFQSVSGFVVLNQALHLPFFLSNAKLSVSPLSLLLTRLDGNLELKAYNGELASKFTAGLFQPPQIVESQLSGLQLGEHPAAQLYGLTGVLDGTFQATLATLESQQHAWEAVSLDLSLREGNVQGGSVPYMPVPLPKISNLEVSMKLIQDEDRLSIESCTLSSSLGSAKCRGWIAVEGLGEISELSVRIDIDLAKDGAEALSGYLALTAGMSPETKHERWRVNVNKAPLKRVRASVKAIG